MVDVGKLVSGCLANGVIQRRKRKLPKVAGTGRMTLMMTAVTCPPADLGFLDETPVFSPGEGSPSQESLQERRKIASTRRRTLLIREPLAKLVSVPIFEGARDDREKRATDPSSDCHKTNELNTINSRSRPHN